MFLALVLQTYICRAQLLCSHLIVALANGEDPRYLLKSRNHVLTAGRGQFSIVVQDPSDPILTTSRHRLAEGLESNWRAYQLLVEKCYELHAASYKNRIGQSILGDIIKYRGKDRDFNDDRDKVVNSALISHLDDEDDSKKAMVRMAR
ncbi:hypothetical protein E0198_001159 [Clavispora lusitaniae]|nr:hypothetical protein E0198_001159 [Clavispora lusitaniae]